VTLTYDERLRTLSPQRQQLLERMRTARTRPACAPAGAPVQLRPGSEAARVVLIHPSGGEIFCYVPLARAVRPGPAVLGFPAISADRDPPVGQRLVAVAERILDALRADGDLGAYVVAGWSFGGSVAFEVVRQLAAAGGPALPVVLLDPPFLDDLTIAIPDEDELRRQFSYDLARLQGVPASALESLLDETAGPIDLETLCRNAGVAPALSADEVQERYLSFAAAATALHRYRPSGAHPGPVYLLTAGPEPEITAGWRSVTTGEFHHDVLPGDHYTVFDAEQLPIVVRAVESALASCAPEQLEVLP
jgi:thioesterase domain-containing protein